jgi:signal transduction histidine kinase
MDLLHTFFQLNRQVIFFVYGLSFFVLGLAIALQSRQHSRLDLARSVPWLAAFGFTHGLNEWGDLFIPIQAAYLGDSAILLLRLIQLLLLAFSFACLFEFGVRLLHPAGRARILHTSALALVIVWVVSVLFILFTSAPTPAQWQREANALARYLIGLPGALLAAYSLRRHALQRIAPLTVPHVVRMLRVAGLALASYALFAGLIPPPVPFFPGDMLNAQTFEATTGVPPAVFRSLIGLALAVAIIRALDIFDLETERFIEVIEQQQILAAERERIARDLHDNAIQKVYTAGLLIESAQQQCPSDSLPAQRLARAALVLNDAIADLRRNLGELHAASASDTSLQETLRRLANDPRFQTLVDIALDLELPEEDSFSAPRVDQVIAIVQEALSNVVRHARARHVRIAARRERERLRLSVQDDGIGLPRPLAAGYGLRNMRDRAHLLGGEIEITGARGKGTQVRLDIPWRDER